MAKYEKFEEWMIGKRVTHVGVKSSGVIVKRPAEDDPNICVIVKYDEGDLAEETIGAFLRNLEFLEQPPSKEEKAATLEGCQIDWQAGQVVWDVRKGRGVVAKVSSANLEYPVIVEFDNGGVHTYTAEGKILLDDLHRSLYFSEPEIVAETMPPKKPFEPKLKEGDKVAIFHVFGVDWEIVTVVREEEDKLYFKHSNGVKDYCGKEHICVKLFGEEIKWD